MKHCLLSALLFVTVHLGYGQSDAYSDKVKHMMEVSGAQANFKAAVIGMMDVMKQQYHEVPTELWQELEVEFLGTSMADLTELITPIYQRHLSANDLDMIIAFYESPAGKKLAEKTPLITQESMAVGQEWGKSIGQKVSERIAEKGY